jgi:O-antigen ligase
MVPGMLLFRPHAFYYEPSFAAGGLALAWALALTRMRDAAPNVASALVIVGAIALLVMTSRTGWLYAAVAGLAVLVFRVCVQRPRPRVSLTNAMIAGAVGIALLFAIFGSADKREAAGGLFDRLGFAQAFERVCPRVAEQFRLNVRCLSGDERRRFLGEGQPFDPDETTEGLRLVALRATVETMAQHPLLGVGVSPGSDRLIAAPVVANLWLELALEGGVLSLLAFVFGITFTMWRLRAFEPRHRDIMIVLGLWLLIAWQFIQTFPRLDLWIAFWVILAWTRRESERRGQVAREPSVANARAKGLTPLGIATHGARNTSGS